MHVAHIKSYYTFVKPLPFFLVLCVKLLQLMLEKNNIHRMLKTDIWGVQNSEVIPVLSVQEYVLFMSY